MQCTGPKNFLAPPTAHSGAALVRMGRPVVATGSGTYNLVDGVVRGSPVEGEMVILVRWSRVKLTIPRERSCIWYAQNTKDHLLTIKYT